MKNIIKNSAAPHNILRNYIDKLKQAPAQDAFALATHRNSIEFEPTGVIFISSTTLHEDFKERFQNNLLSAHVPVEIDLVGSPKIGFISTKNCLRVILSEKKIAIQLKIEHPFSSIEIAKIGVAATKAATTQKNIVLSSFSDSSLSSLVQQLLQAEGFFIENNEES